MSTRSRSPTRCSGRRSRSRSSRDPRTLPPRGPRSPRHRRARNRTHSDPVPREKDPMSERHAGHKHPYHLVDPSPWPVVGAACTGFLAAMTVLYLHYGLSVWMVVLAVALLIALMAVWWRGGIKEAVYRGYRPPVAQVG